MIPGLRYIPGYLDPAAHDALLAAVDVGQWRPLGVRRTQIYGYSYDRRKGGAYRVEDLPDQSRFDLCDGALEGEWQLGTAFPRADERARHLG
jgi:hypothetical protein